MVIIKVGLNKFNIRGLGSFEVTILIKALTNYIESGKGTHEDAIRLLKELDSQFSAVVH